VSDRDLPVSDDERSHVVDLLQRATGSGALDLPEFEQRVDRALAARTRAELNVLLLDLPGLTHPDHRPAPPARPAGAPPAARAVETVVDGAVQLSTTLGSLVRKGRWDVPARLSVRATLGSVELDFTEAAVPPRVDIALEVVAGSVAMRFPPGAHVTTDGIEVALASVENKVADGDGPRFVLTGSVRAGSLELKGPRKRWLRGR
jgi:hypothetical protein